MARVTTAMVRVRFRVRFRVWFRVRVGAKDMG
jgi:hypothetical protein